VQFQQLARQMAAARIFTCPSLYWYEVNWLQYPLDYLQRLPGVAYVCPAVRQEWRTAENQQLKPGGSPTAAHGGAADVRPSVSPPAQGRGPVSD
jgi:hypothetical protein